MTSHPLRLLGLYFPNKALLTIIVTLPNKNIRPMVLMGGIAISNAG
jgi:hypothetical protein